MLTDAQGLKLIKDMRRSTSSAHVAELLDWVLTRLEAGAGAAPKPKADRRAYMKDYMRKRRAEQRRDDR
jgi:hypothetical protein